MNQSRFCPIEKVEMTTSENVCGDQPSGNAHQCCVGIEKIVPIEMFTRCLNHTICPANCIGREMGLLKDDKYDHDTALQSLVAAAGNDTNWINVSIQLE